MTSFSMYLSFSVVGHAEGQADEVRESVKAFLEGQQLWADFNDGADEDLSIMRLVKGGSLIQAGTHYPVIVANPSRWPIEARFNEWITTRFGSGCITRFSMLDFDSSEPWEHSFHYVQSGLCFRTEAARGLYKRGDVPFFLRDYRLLEAWEQRAELHHLLWDWKPKEDLNELFTDLLSSPPATENDDLHTAQVEAVLHLGRRGGAFRLLHENFALVARCLAYLARGGPTPIPLEELALG